MLTIDQIKLAHSKVKSGADFPKYVQEIKKAGVVSYDNHVADGHTDYFGTDNFRISGDAKYPAIEVSATGVQKKPGTCFKDSSKRGDGLFHVLQTGCGCRGN